MRRWSELAERVASTTRTSEKTALLAEYLRTLDEDELRIAVVFLTGRPFPEADQRATGIGWATIANAVGQVTGAARGELGAAYDRLSDLSAAVGDVLAKAGHAPDPAGSP
jgi:DNA ligase-1